MWSPSDVTNDEGTTSPPNTPPDFRLLKHHACPVHRTDPKETAVLRGSTAVLRDHFNLGKKISIPWDLMMEELNLRTNRGSRMFQERQKRVEKFTLESVGGKPKDLIQKEDRKATEVITSPKKIKKGNPSVLAPGYSGPLKGVPHEKFNVTIVPKCYCSPWEKTDGNETLLANISALLPESPYKLTPATYKCFNRAPMPFKGTAGSKRTLSLPGFEMQQTFTEPILTWERICDRPNFNCAPVGWRAQYAETGDL